MGSVKTGTIFYGFPLNSELLFWNYNNSKFPSEKSSFSSFKELGFKIFERDNTGFFGIELDLIHDVGHLMLEKIVLQPTAEQIEFLHFRIKKLPENLQKIIPKVDVYLMWHT